MTPRRSGPGYRGVVTTDSLQMAGVLQGHTSAEAAVMAIQAGCDQLLMPGSVPVAYHAIMAAVSGGQISMTRLDTSVTRIIGLLRPTAAGLATYSSAGVSLAAAAAVLTGELGPAGRLPVAVPGPGGGIVYPYGTGLHY